VARALHNLGDNYQSQIICNLIKYESPPAMATNQKSLGTFLRKKYIKRMGYYEN